MGWMEFDPRARRGSFIYTIRLTCPKTLCVKILKFQRISLQWCEAKFPYTCHALQVRKTQNISLSSGQNTLVRITATKITYTQFWWLLLCHREPLVWKFTQNQLRELHTAHWQKIIFRHCCASTADWLTSVNIFSMVHFFACYSTIKFI